MTAKKKKRLGYTYAVGRRKTATARVRFYTSDDPSKEGTVVVNEKAYNEYFNPQVAPIIVEPLKLIAAEVGGYFTLKVSGGGDNSQAEAVRHGISRLLVSLNEDWKTLLKQKGYLKRDSRMKERKKPGLKRARRAPQWSKR